MDRLLEETRRRLRESEALFGVSQAFTSVLDLDELLQVVVDSAVETIDSVERGVIHILDEASGELHPKALSGKALGGLRERKMLIGEGVAGYALEQGRAINVPDVNAETHFVRDRGDPGFKSLLVVPLILGQKRIGILSVDSERVGAFTEDDEQLLTILATQGAIAIQNARLYEEVQTELTERKRVEEALRKRTRNLDERVKELTCLYGVSSLAEKPGVLLEDIFQGSVDLLPPSWQYPEVTCARITVEGQEYATEDFRETKWKQVADVIVHGERAGVVEVGYLEERPPSDEGPFLKEERALINAVAEQLGRTTERERMEEALRESEEQFRQFFEKGPEYCYMISPEGIILDVNDTALKALGYRKEELVGKPLKTLYAPESLPRMKQLLAKWQETGELRDEEMVVITREGNRRTVLLSAGVVKGRDGEVLHSVSVQRDITERKRAEDEIKRVAGNLARLIETANAPIFGVDADGKVNERNQAAPRISG